MKTKPFRTLVLVALVAILGGLAWQMLRPSVVEPVYQGKPLSYWLGKVEFGRIRDVTGEEAVRQTGSNAIPYLLKMASAKDSSIIYKVNQFASKLPTPLRFHMVTGNDRRKMGYLGFAILGPVGKPAVPRLIELLNDRDKNVREYAAINLGHIGPVEPGVVPALIKALADTNGFVQTEASEALSMIGPTPVVPLLMERLRNAKKNPPSSGLIHALAQFGTNAAAAYPIILPFLNDKDPDVRFEAASALRELDPEAAAKAGVSW